MNIAIFFILLFWRIIFKRTKNNSNDYKKRKEGIIKEQNKLLDTIQTIYKDRLEGNITPNQYKILSKPYEDKLKNLNNILEDINNEIQNEKDNTDKYLNYEDKIKKLLNLNNPNKNLLFALIERIEADKDRNIIIKLKYNILDNHTFKYKDIRVRNPYGRKGKIS